MSKTFLIISLFIVSVSPSQSNNSHLESINQLKWDNRVILVRSMNNLEDILSALKIADSKIQDRHINWFVFSQSDIYTNYEGDIAESFQKDTVDKYFSADGFSIVLIGKDGGIKEKTKTLNLNAIFELIDSMPMRQIEMENE